MRLKNKYLTGQWDTLMGHEESHDGLSAAPMRRSIKLYHIVVIVNKSE